ncbi:hypothetical protein B0H10DRAFT_1947916 [Mycena sp. CBHHK59/15]|nr:hypothetical protein B0H10DRAFT_1947916 [Mycena sp. CBHHK59/15]
MARAVCNVLVVGSHALQPEGVDYDVARPKLSVALPPRLTTIFASQHLRVQHKNIMIDLGLRAWAVGRFSRPKPILRQTHCIKKVFSSLLRKKRKCFRRAKDKVTCASNITAASRTSRTPEQAYGCPLPAARGKPETGTCADVVQRAGLSPHPRVGIRVKQLDLVRGCATATVELDEIGLVDVELLTVGVNLTWLLEAPLLAVLGLIVPRKLIDMAVVAETENETGREILWFNCHNRHGSCRPVFRVQLAMAEEARRRDLHRRRYNPIRSFFSSGVMERRDQKTVVK